MAEIVLVHGIAQEQRSADTLEAEWIPALIGGMRNAGFADVADRTKASPQNIRMAFYGGCFLIKGRQGAPAELQDLTLAADEADLPDQIAQEWLNRAALTDREAQLLRNVASGQIGAEPQGLRASGVRLVALLSKSKWFSQIGFGFAERFVDKSLAQVVRYLTDDSVREVAQTAVLNLITDDTKVVVGHSLGSVVAFEALHRVDRRIPVLITLGSPLGLKTVITTKLRPQPPTFPPCLRRWVNVASPDDVVAAVPDMTGLFGEIPSGATFEGSYTVDNGSSPHNAGFYLGKEEVGTAIATALH